MIDTFGEFDCSYIRSFIVYPLRRQLMLGLIYNGEPFFLRVPSCHIVEVQNGFCSESYSPRGMVVDLKQELSGQKDQSRLGDLARDIKCDKRKWIMKLTDIDRD